MKTLETKNKIYQAVFIPLSFVFLLWFVFWIETNFKIDFSSYGIYPRTISGLKGVLFSPFIHGSLSHLYNNSIPLLVLGASLLFFYKPISVRVLLFGWIMGGLLTWLVAREAYHIGASLLIYMLVSFIFFTGILSKHFRLVALSLLVVFIYGSMMWYVFPIEEKISWEGHLSGFISGLILALIYGKKMKPAPKYDWEKPDYNEASDPFLQHFDQDGNFIENKDESTNETESKVKINYNYRANKSDNN